MLDVFGGRYAPSTIITDAFVIRVVTALDFQKELCFLFFFGQFFVDGDYFLICCPCVHFKKTQIHKKKKKKHFPETHFPEYLWTKPLPIKLKC